MDGQAQLNASRRAPAPAVRCAIIALLALTLAACAILQQVHFEPPRVELDSVDVTGLGLAGGSLSLWLDVYNPNGYELRTIRVEAGLDLEHTHFGDALLEEVVTLAPRSHTRVQLPVSFTWEGVGAGARALLERGALTYQLDTNFRIDISGSRRTLGFRSRGQVAITDLTR
ncbi:MAG: hypothetical protein AMS25_02470 [Gemmatimonas sp. SM23_52]|nr:MAG: hypothetical protein AMS25_02470 [Gemmatimonas sp. SM23_52]